MTTTLQTRNGRDMVKNLNTISLAYTKICQGEAPWVALGNFMNDFFGYFLDEREQLLREPIQEPAEPTEEQHRWALFCAASVEYLCEKYGLPLPAWTTDFAHAPLPQPWDCFSNAAPDMHEYLRQATPPAFQRRNIYCGPNPYANKYEEAQRLRNLLKHSP